jgi:hypothetical protein
MREILDISKIYNSNAEIKNFKLIKATWKKEDHEYWTPKEHPAYSDLYPLHWIYREESKKDIGNDYVALVHKEYGTMMSSHASEIVSCKDFLDQSYGDILNFGLGLGIVIFPLLDDPIVNSIKIVELDKELIELISPYIKERDIHNKVSIIHGDAFTYYRELKEKFDTIFFDIWPTLYRKTIDEIEYLHKVYSENLKTKESLMLSWCYDDMKKYFNR